MEKKTFKDFPYVSLRKSGDLRGGANFDPRGIIWTNLVEHHYMMLYTKYQSSRPGSYREEDFLKICHK